MTLRVRRDLDAVARERRAAHWVAIVAAAALVTTASVRLATTSHGVTLPDLRTQIDGVFWRITGIQAHTRQQILEPLVLTQGVVSGVQRQPAQPATALVAGRLQPFQGLFRFAKAETNHRTVDREDSS